MLNWKLRIIMNAIKTRMKEENRTAADIIEEYTALSAEEKTEILNNI